jgi:hypothetical protein
MLQRTPITARLVCIHGEEWDLTSRRDLEGLARQLRDDRWDLSGYTISQLREIVWQILLLRSPR